MASANNINPMPVFEPKTDITNTGARWTNWLERFQTYLLAADVKEPQRQRALLLYQAGPEVYNIFKTLPETGDEKDYKKAVDALTKHFEPDKNQIFEIYNFRQATQMTEETIDEFHTRLRTLAKHCKFHDEDFEIKMQIVCNGKSARLRRKALREPDYKLAEMLIDGRKAEMSSAQASGMEESFQELHVKEIRTENTCYKCGFSYPHRNKPCPAKHAVCSSCGLTGHFAKLCRKKQQTPQRKPLQSKEPQTSTRPKKESNFVKGKRRQRKAHAITRDNDDQSSSSDDEYAYAVEAGNKLSTKTQLRLNDSFDLTFLVDTGATVNIIDSKTYESLQHQIKLEPAKTKIFAYGSATPLQLKGCFSAMIESKSRYTVSQFYVVDGSGGNLLSGKTAHELKLIQLVNKINETQTSDSKNGTNDHKETTEKKTNLPSSTDGNIQRLLNRYQNVFEGEGKLKDQRVKLHIKDDVNPIVQPQRRIPYHMRKAVSKELKKLTEQDIIEKVVDQPTPWVSPIVCIPKKDGGTRICVDMREANNAIKRERHIMPTLNDFKAAVNGAKYFSKIDLKQAYHQVELEPESRFITTFSTHEGIYQYKRLNYGTSSAAEVFQNILQRNLSDIPGVKNIADDIIIFGKDRKEHDIALEACLKRLSDLNIKAKGEKCKFLQQEIKFYGLIFTEKGTRPDPERVKHLLNTAPPQNASEVRSFLGMANTCSDYIPNYATLTQPLRELTKKNSTFKWTVTEQRAFNQLKKKLTQSPVMAYFDTEKHSVLIVDGSQHAVGAILAQREKDGTQYKIVSYASRALTPVESRYSQTDIEGLALVWGIEHFRLFLLGKEFDVITDHKALESIFNNPRSKPPARVERWVLRLQPYNFRVIYKKGSQNEADYLSRHPINKSQSESNEEQIAEEYVNYIIENTVPKTMTLEEVKDATRKDQVLQRVKKAVESGTWDTKDLELQPYKRCADELTVNNTKDIIMKGCRMVIPKSLQNRATKLGHVGHQGIEKTKSLIREKIWFPKLDEKVREIVENCVACQAVGNANSPEPMQITPIVDIPWHTVAVDFHGPITNTQQYLLVVTDLYSKFPEIEIVNSTAAPAVIPKLDRIFATHGIPVKLKTDNGPPFNGAEFERYTKALGMEWKPSTPLWPQGNSNVESLMKPIGKVLQTAQLEGKNWKQELQRFLLTYRTTPHVTTKVPPCELLFNRTIRGQLPELPAKKVLNKHKQAKENIEKKKAQNKEYYDKKHNTKESEIKEGDTVICLQKRTNKLAPKFSPERFIVHERKGTKIIAKNQQHIITRNVSHFKKVPTLESNDNDEEDISDDENRTEKKEQEKNQVDDVRPRRSQRSKIPVARFGYAVPSNLKV